MDCAYCQCGWTRRITTHCNRALRWPSAPAVEAAIAERLARAARTNELLDRITIAGHGEPTLHPEFEDVMTRVRDVRGRAAPDLPIAILSNSTSAAWPDVRRGLALCDERYMKLDAGDPLTYAQINGAGPALTDLLDGLRSLPSITVQSMFVTDDAHAIDNSTDGAVAAWLDALDAIKAAAVHLYTLDRSPARGTLKPVPRRRLREIAERVRAAGIPATEFA
jgi:wyosine [tRNA(Phe)-imidazoG37] synthetase (radical SAM superfamily)